MHANKTKSFLLIDDDPISNMISTKVIELVCPFNVIPFTNAIEALAQLRQWSTSDAHSIPAIIFLDINMPYMDGWEFLEEFHKLPQNILEQCEVIMLTSSIDVRDIEKSRRYAAVQNFVSKPLTADKVKALVNIDIDKAS